MARDKASRKWQITFNNPKEHGFSHENIKKILCAFGSLAYWCMCDEIGEKGTYHTHLYVVFKNAVMFSTIKKRFESAHFEMARGTSQQNRDYIRKEGKWEKDKKRETNLPDTFEEDGDIPIERQGARTDLADLYDMIQQGMSNAEILEQCPEYLFNIDKIERCRQTVKEDRFKSSWREIAVTYISGKTATGKTRGVMEQYGYENVYRVTGYEHPFDNYKGQEVLLFDEFRSSLRIQDMLIYLEGYPVQLPCRYTDRTACFTKVYIISNLELEEQYLHIQREHSETWNAFLRRIDVVKVYGEGTIEEYSVDDYLCRMRELPRDSYVPFENLKGRVVLYE